MARDRKIPIYVFHPAPTRAPSVDRERAEAPPENFYLPLALGMIVERARQADTDARWDFDLPLLTTREALLDAVREHGPGVCLFSNYVWSVDANLAASEAVRAAEPRCLNVHGGPSTPKYTDASETFLRSHRHVDVAVRGEGEETAAALFTAIADAVGEDDPRRRREALSSVAGIAFLDDRGNQVRTADRPLLQDLGALPSPYLTAAFDRMLAQRAATLPGGHVLTHATLETNRGCPYGCTFCDWGSLTLQKIRLFDLARVRAEVEWIARHGVQDVFIADANVGILPRDVEVAEIIASAKRTYGAPRSLSVNYTKNGSEHLGRIFEIWKSAGIAFEATVSIQTTDPATLVALRRTNIKTKKYVELSELYRGMGVPVRRQLMSGLPGQTVASWKNDLQLCFERGETAQLFATRLLPNSPMSDPEYRARYQIRTNAANLVVETSSFTEADWQLMQRIGNAFMLHHNWGILRHYLLHLDLDHGIRAIDVVHEHTEAVHGRPDAYPEGATLLGPILDTPWDRAPTAEHLRRFHERGWSAFLEELARFVHARYGVAVDSAGEVALRAQEAVLPRRGAAASRLALAHDFAGYARAGRAALRAERRDVRPLRDHPAGVLRVADPGERSRDLGVLADLWSSDTTFLLPSSIEELEPETVDAASPPSRGRWPDAIATLVRRVPGASAQVGARGESVAVWLASSSPRDRLGVVIEPLAGADPGRVWKKTATTAVSYRGELSRVAAVADELLRAIRQWEESDPDAARTWWLESAPTLAGQTLMNEG